MTVSQCHAAQHERARRLQRYLQTFETVDDATVLAPHEGAHTEWTVSAIVSGATVDALLLEAIASVGGSLLPDATGTRTEPRSTEVVVQV